MTERGKAEASNQILKECRMWSLVELCPVVDHGVPDSTQCMGVAVNTNRPGLEAVAWLLTFDLLEKHCDCPFSGFKSFSE